MQRILIIENEWLLGAGIQNLLAGKSNLDVIGISPPNQERLVHEINRLRPDVIVLNEDSRLVGPTKLLSLLKDLPTLRIVVISADHYLASIYDKRGTPLYGSTDLCDIIREKVSDDQT